MKNVSKKYKRSRKMGEYSFDTPISGAPNFTLAELCRSYTATRHGIANVPTKEECENLIYLACTTLQPVRDHFGEPLVVNSGFRSEALNNYVGGSKTSFHRHGMAADIQFGNNSQYRLIDLFSYIYNNIPYVELIAEELPDGWIHVAANRMLPATKVVKYKYAGGSVRRGSYDEIMRKFSGIR